jgi:ABC-type amino acid transport substrate-binding protein
MKILLRYLIVALLLLPSIHLQAQRTVNRIVQTGEIRIGITAQQPPFSVKSSSGSVIGFDIDIANKLATSIHVKADFIEMNFADLLGALDRDEIDIVMSGMAITSERNLEHLFAGPYLISGKSILTKNRKIIEAPIRELNMSRIEVATLKGSTSETFVKDNLPNAQSTLVDSYKEAVEMVIKGSVDFMLADYSECAYASFRNQDHGLLIQEELLNMERIGIAIPSDDPLLLNLIQNFILDLEQTGELKKIEDKWFRSGSWLGEVK